MAYQTTIRRGLFKTYDVLEEIYILLQAIDARESHSRLQSPAVAYAALKEDATALEVSADAFEQIIAALKEDAAALRQLAGTLEQWREDPDVIELSVAALRQIADTLEHHREQE